MQQIKNGEEPHFYVSGDQFGNSFGAKCKFQVKRRAAKRLPRKPETLWKFCSAKFWLLRLQWIFVCGRIFNSEIIGSCKLKIIKCPSFKLETIVSSFFEFDRGKFIKAQRCF